MTIVSSSEHSDALAHTQPYRVKLNLHHPNRDPEGITQELGLTPWFSRCKGDSTGGVLHKQSSWLCHFQNGSSSAEFEDTLQAIVAFIDKHRVFFKSFAEDCGTAEIELNADVLFDSGVIYDLSLAPLFLEELARANIHLRLKVWSERESSE